MTSSLGDQLSALLGRQNPDERKPNDAKASGGANGTGNDYAAAAPGQGRGHTGGRSADAELPAGVHGDVAAIVKDIAPTEVESLDLTTSLSDLGFDRLGVVELAIRCEEQLGVRIEDKDIPSFTTLGDVVNYIAARRG